MANARGPRSHGASASPSPKQSQKDFSPLGQFLERLQKVRRSGTSYVARCPAHDDRHPSLSITEVADRRLLVHCHAGCSAEAVVSALGFGLRDLFADDRARPRYTFATRRRAHPVPRRLVEGLLERKAFPFEWETAKALAHVPDQLAQRDILASWDYLEGRVDIELVVALSRCIREVKEA